MYSYETILAVKKSEIVLVARVAQYDRAVLAFNALCVLFYVAAIGHLFQKPNLPDDRSFSVPQSRVQSIDNISVVTSEDVEFFLTGYRVGDTVRVESVTPGGVVSQRVCLVHYNSPVDIAIDIFTALGIFLLSVYVCLKRPGEAASSVFNLVSGAVAAAVLGTKTIYSLHPWWLGYSLCVLFFFAYTLLPVLFLHFTFVFPVVRWKDFRRWIGWLYLLAVVLAVWQSSVYLWAAAFHSIDLFHAFVTKATIQNGFVFLILLLSVGTFAYSYKNAATSSEKKKLRWILFGLCVGPTPFIFLWVLPLALGTLPLISENAFKLILLLVPTTFTISILRYRLLDIDVIINRSTVYFILLGILLTAYVGIVGGLATFVHTSSVVTSAAAAVVVALVFEPMRQKVQHFVDKKFFRVQYNYREEQRKFVEGINQCLDVNQVADLIVGRTQELIAVERIGFFMLRQPGHRIQLLAHRRFDILERHGVRFEAESLRTDLKRIVALADYVEPGILHEPANAGVFRRWGMALVFPVLSGANEIFGFLVLGGKESGGRFTFEDIDLLRTVTIQAGLVIERITLQQQLLLKREEARRLEELNQLKSFFVSSVSHDLKTPLTSIKMFAELLRSKLGSEQREQRLSPRKASEYLEIIEGESDRLARLINNVLDFTKMERGIKEYHFSSVEVHRVVKDVIKSLEYQFKINKFSLSTALSKKEYIICADADAIAEALINLISNAMKYSGERKELTVSTFDENDHVVIQLADKGIGISAENIVNIFEEFYRVRDSKTQRVGGVGLGLSIVKHIMDAHKGRVEVQSVVGEGSTFTLLFPLGDGQTM